MNQKRQYVIKAILFSVLLHLIFVIISAVVHIGRISMEYVKTHDVFKVKRAESKYSEPTKYTNDTKDRSSKSTNPVDASKNVDRLEKTFKDSFKEDKTQPKIAESWKPESKPVQDDRPLKDLGHLEKKLTPVQKTEKRAVPQVITALSAEALNSKTAEASSPAQLFDTTSHEDDLQMEGFTPSYNDMADDKESWQSLTPFTQGNAALTNESLGFEDANQHLICELFTYTDAQDNQKYFQIRVRAGKKVDELKRIPREIVFLVDSSLSIQPERLDEFKKGLKHGLSQLDPKDSFNVRVFKENVVFLSPTSLSPTQDNIKKAMDFIDLVVSGQGTDTYGAFFQSIQTPEDKNPSYLFLLSDGKPTLGELDSTKIIREISRVNNGNKGIFAFSGGSRVNRYLLDFISYRNRGWSEYSSKTYQIYTYLTRMLDKIKDPVLLNLRYNLSGVDIKEVYPKMLPDFFRNAEINLYGKYTGEDKIVVRFLADREGKTHELKIETSFDQAQAGDETIMKNWAYNKIYDLIGRMDDSSKFNDLLWNVQEISRKFGIQTPYTKSGRD